MKKNKIEVGEYIRTKKGNIGKVIGISNCTGQKREKYLIKFINLKVYYITATTINKNSNNIIDLIEVGDYVNGEEITYIDEDPFIKRQINLWTDVELRDVYGDYERLKYTDEDIKTIVTKEKFKEMEYRV